MFTIRGIYENGKVKLLEPLPFKKRARVIVTIIDESTEGKEASMDLFKDLIGAISVKEDGSEKHDKYIYEKANL